MVTCAGEIARRSAVFRRSVDGANGDHQKLVPVYVTSSVGESRTESAGVGGCKTGDCETEGSTESSSIAASTFGRKNGFLIRSGPGLLELVPTPGLKC
ncbi:MAG: hypothetical protein ACI814_003606 [Mariniblastus sp.]|jgi:hypothetical protein